MKKLPDIYCQIYPESKKVTLSTYLESKIRNIRMKHAFLEI